MKLRNLFMAVVAGAAMLVGCNKEVDLGPAKLALDQTTLAFEAAGGSQTVSVTATRDWAVSGVPDWVALSATSGKAAVEAQPVKITVAQNAEYNRSATIVFTIGFARTSLTINQAGPEGEIDNGDGTLENPFNVAGVIEYVNELGADVASPKKVFVAGIISAVDEEFNTQYGNGAFKISDDGKTTGAQFTAYRILYLGNKKFAAGDTQIKVGDEVIIYGNVVNYKGNTPETQQGNAFLYSLNGVDKGGAEGGEGGGTGEPKGSGTLEDPFNPAGIAAVAEKLADNAVSEQSYYMKGKISKIAVSKGVDQTFANSGSYGNASFYIADAEDGTGEFYIYQTYYLGNRKWVTGDTDIKVGDEVIVYGPVTKYVSSYGTTLETSGKGASYIYSLNGATEGGDTPGGGDDYSSAASKTVEEFIQLADKSTYYKLTGTVSKFNPTYCSFDLTDASGTIYVYSVLAAYKTDEWKNKIKNGGTITIAGKYEYYANKSQHEVVDAAILEYTDGQGGGDEPGGDDYSTAASKTVEEFIQLADKSTYYKLTGTVSKFNPTYCSFDLTDASGTIYVYSVLAAYKTDEWKNKIKNGGTITIAGKYEYYANKSQHEVVDAAILEYTDGQGGGDEPGGNEPEGGIYASSVTWTLGDKAYSEKAIVNDVENVPVLKLGTSSKIGTATLTIPSGATKITFYAVSWSGKPSKLVFKNGDTELGSVSPAANTGLANSSPYTLTVTDADKYEIAVSGATSITVQTDGSNKRAALFAIVSE